MVDFSLQLQRRELEALPFRKMSQERIGATVLRQSMQEILAKYRTRVRRELATVLGISARIINPRVRIHVPKQSDMKNGKLRASIFVGTYRIPVIKTLKTGSKIRAGSSGLVVGSKTKDKFSLSRGSFLAKMSNGKVMIASRTPGAARATGRDKSGNVRRGRLPLEELMITVNDAAERALAGLIQSAEFVDDVSARFVRKLEQYVNG